MQECLNGDISNPAKYHPICEIEKGDYKMWECSDTPIYMDVNTLELRKGDLPIDAAKLAPQYRFYGRTNVRCLCLNVTHACQLRCKYCYLSHFYPEMEVKMDFATARKAVDMFFPAANTKQPMKLSFFGGEPLLNFSMIKKTVAYVKKQYPALSVSFSMTTNAVAMTDEIASFLRLHRFSLIVSMDGPKEMHDGTRVYADQKGTYDDVMAGLECLKRAGVYAITLRGTFLPAAKGTLLERVKYLNELCDAGYARGVSVEPACLSESCARVPDEMKFSVDDVRSMRQEYLDIADWVSERIANDAPARIHNIMVYVDRLVNKKQYCTECGAGMGYLSVSPDGKLFACHREMSSNIGDIQKGGIEESKRAEWVDNRYYQNPSCNVCKIRNVCGGPCREHNITTNDDINKNDPVSCAFYHNWIEAAVRVVDKVDCQVLKSIVMHKAPLTRYNFVREGGGFGDILSMGGAAQQLKHENPKSHVTLCIPNEFIPMAKCLQGVDSIAGLGPLDYLSQNRRARKDKFVRTARSYFVVVPEGQVVDMWGPGYLYEVAQESGLLDLTRSQLFAKEAGCKDVSRAVPVWKVSREDREWAIGAFDALFKVERPVIAFAPRATDSNRSLPMELIEELLDALQDYNVLYLDCQLPSFTRPHSNTNIPKNTKFTEAVAIAEQADILITVDSAFLHVGAALKIPTVGIFTMTDPAPYKNLYPVICASYSGKTDACTIPCNRSTHKGFSSLCTDNCLRKHLLTVDMLMPAIAQAFQLGIHPEFQALRLKRMLL